MNINPDALHIFRMVPHPVQPGINTDVRHWQVWFYKTLDRGCPPALWYKKDRPLTDFFS